MNLKNKNILFFAPSFFGYEKKIAGKMMELGANVDFFDERSVKSSFEKALLKVNPRIFNHKSSTYYNNIIDGLGPKDYDFIFVIKCEMMPIDIIKKLKKKFNNACFCLYLYDSLDNIKGIESKLNLFDRVLSFDKKDVEKHSKLIFRPLFFIDEYKRTVTKQKNYKYDLSFIGTIHSDRYEILKQIKKIANNDNFNFYLYNYLQSRFIYTFYKLIKKEFRGTTLDDFRFDKISSETISEIIEQTKVVVDIQHPRQSGLTMRTIEMLGMNKKLITTNKNIKYYDFYNPANIIIIDRTLVSIPDGIIEKEYVKVEQEIYERYTLQSWIFEVLGLDE